jgi:tripartite-type tricarboxylate transporter receptor subunit TctC
MRIALLAAVFLAIQAVPPSHAASDGPAYPTKPIRLIIPFPPGGAVDAIGRIVGQRLAEKFGQSVVFDNRAGASGAIGSELVARAVPDGYTLLVGSTSTISINPSLRPGLLPYRPERDFTPVSIVGYVPHIVVVSNGVPASTVKEFIAYAKAQKKPVTYASVGTGSPHHLAGEIFKRMAGIEMVHVPYKGSGPALIDIMGGQVQFLSVDMPAVMPLIESGKLKPLGIAAGKRDPLLPKLPTVSESGLPGFEITGWYGIFAPSKTPKNIVAKLSSEIGHILETQDARGALAKIGVTVLGGTPADGVAFVKRETAKWAKAIKDSGTKVE